MKPNKLESLQRLNARRASHHAALETLRAPSCTKTGKQIWLALRKQERIAHEGSTAYCNGDRYNLRPGTSFDFRGDEDAWSQFSAATHGEIAKIFGHVPPGFFVNADARGNTLKLDSEKVKIPEGMETDWGGDGILAAEIN